VTTETVRAPLVGRAAEVEAVELFLDRIAQGAEALFLEGEPGIGKTRVWTEGVRLAQTGDVRVLRTRPAGAEAEFAYAGLGDLLRDAVGDLLPELPSPQRRALAAALLLEADGAPSVDGHAVGAATLGGLRLLARERPVVVAVDDAHWLDAATRDALAFAVRRLDDEPVGILATVRVAPEVDAGALASALPEPRVTRLRLGPLTVASLFEIVRDRFGFTLSRATLLRLHQESGGNPFYALEVARMLARSSVEPRPGDPLPVPSDLRELVRARLTQLSPRSAEVVLAAAALARPTVSILERVFDDADDALAEAMAASVVEIEADAVRFAHPLLGSIHYEEARRSTRRELHGLLADVVEDAEERARHLALASAGPDPTVARALAEAAKRAAARGALASAAELAELAANLTPAGLPGICDRLLVAAELRNSCGDPVGACALLDNALAHASTEATRAEVLIRAGVVADQMQDSRGAVALYDAALDAAGDNAALRSRVLAYRAGVLGVDSAEANERFADEAVMWAERSGDRRALMESRSILGHMRYVRSGDVDHELMERAISLEESLGPVSYESGPTEEYAQQLLDIWEIGPAREILERLAATARARDDVALTYPLEHLALVEQLAGNWDEGAALAAEAAELAAQSGRTRAEIWALFRLGEIEGRRGNVDEARAACERSLRLAERTGGWTRGARLALGVLESSLENYPAAWSYLDPSDPRTGSLGPDRPIVHVPEAVEVLAALGRTDEARAMLEPFSHRAAELDRAWALIAAAHCRGLILVADGDVAGAEAPATEAVTLAREQPFPLVLGRALLALGAARRRLRKKQAARTTLREAFDVFTQPGAPIWARRAEGELRRIGGRSSPAGEALSATEERIVELARSGRTNREIAEAMSLSPKTVEWNLSKIYRKLGVRSRTELAASR
jgi:DNA-binding CsgD family transcriptional regulator